MSEKDDPTRKGQTALKSRPKTEKPRLYKVLVHNDDYTTQEFVVDVLQRIFHKTREEATHLMLFVHTKGRAVAGAYPLDIAESKVERAQQFAQAEGHPLLLTMEPE
ncbi:MAG: ATP-dependent Clp protease adaptor protein ClpS [Bradymonadia bacterium]|jgi:ATP-dependent Clp protease adaptor protein ClpS